MEKAKHYKVGTDQQQLYFKDYNIAPKGCAFLEPGVYAKDAKEFVAFNIAKSFYQVYPEVFNLPYIANKVGLKEDEIKRRIKRMYDERLFMLVSNSYVGIMGFGLYYWVVKLKDDTTKEEREALTKWMQDNDQICTGYMMEEGGDFDYFNGNHMRNLDNLIYGVLDKFRFNRCVEYVHILPIRRLVRESHVNMFDAKENVGHYFWSDEQKEKVLKIQNKMDKYDFAIIDAINNCESVGNMFDYDVLARLSGLDAKEMKEDIIKIVDEQKTIIPMIYFNYASLGLKLHFFVVSLFQNTPTYRAEQICDELAQDPAFENIFDCADGHHNYVLSVYDGITDIEKIRQKILGYGEVIEVLEADSPRQFRRWTCRLDDKNGFYEECIFTDDVLLDRSKE